MHCFKDRGGQSWTVDITYLTVERVKAAASKDGWHGFRTTREDGSIPNFAHAVTQ